MSRPIARRSTLLLAAAAALMVAAFAAVPAAQASTLYACVSKSGSAHLYTKKPKKCKSKKEKLVSWNNVGPAGKNGANGGNGANGTNGTNGAVAGFSATQVGSVDITSEKKLILSKSLPAGSYLVTAKVETAASGKSSGQMESRCELTDGATLDESQWISGMSEFLSGVFLASTTLPLQSPVTLTKTTNVQVKCETQLNKATSGEMSATDGQLFAVQTSAIG